MEGLIYLWQSTLYLRPTAIFITFVSIILFFFSKNRYGNIPQPIKFYLIAYFISFIPVDLTVIIRNRVNRPVRQFVNYIDYLFTFIEFLLFTYYFYSINKNRNHKKILRYLTIMFSITFFVFSFQLPSEQAVVRLYTTQVFCLLIPTFFYFKTLFKNTAIINISNDPSFWISTGIAFLSLCTMSLSLVETFFLSHRPDILVKLYPIYYVFYILMFLMFLKAYSCKPATHGS